MQGWDDAFTLKTIIRARRIIEAATALESNHKMDINY